MDKGLNEDLRAILEGLRAEKLACVAEKGEVGHHA